MGRLRWVPLAVALVGGLLVLAPFAQALNVATKGIKAQPSELHSPETAWEQDAYGCGVTVAVFDNGVDDEHPYFEEKVLAGHDTTATQPAWQEANDGNPQPVTGSHGTPVAGIAVGHAEKPFFSADEAPPYGEDDMVGVAPCAFLVDVMFSDAPNVAPDSEATDSLETDMVEAFEWAIEHRDHDWGDDDPRNDGIDVITMSWSPNDQTDGSDPVCQAATEAVEAGIVVLGSAGNSGSTEEPDLGCPTGADGAISVANLWNKRTVDREDDDLRESSTWGPRTDDGDGNAHEELKPTVAAPGHNVVSTSSSLADGREYGFACFGHEVETPAAAIPNPYGCETSFGGTSAATPMTAGVVALMLDANPDLEPREVRHILQQTADPHPDMELSADDLSAKWDQRYGYGMVDAYEAVEMASTWPGPERGPDTDADGARDFLDVAPEDPSLDNVTVPEDLEPANASVDADGDGVVDPQDGAPFDPTATEEQLASASTEPEETPGPGIATVFGALLVAVAAARRRQAS
jgi:subtilisin family serine protease